VLDEAHDWTSAWVAAELAGFPHRVDPPMEAGSSQRSTFASAAETGARSVMSFRPLLLRYGFLVRWSCCHRALAC
jgi:hypothetical protein